MGEPPGPDYFNAIRLHIRHPGINFSGGFGKKVIGIGSREIKRITVEHKLGPLCIYDPRRR